MSLAVQPFSYKLPIERIAQRPVYPYDHAKLLVSSPSGLVARKFFELDQLLKPGDLLVLNDTVVRPVRFVGILEGEGRSAAVEIFLTGQRGEGEFEALGKPMRKLERAGTRIRVDEQLAFVVLERLGEKSLVVRAEGVRDRAQVEARGLMPIPPYIRKGLSDATDRADYQTRFAHEHRERFGSVAAPTASLHFTDELVSRLEQRGVQRSFLTLDVGTASLLSVVQEDGSVRPPSAERMNVPQFTIDAIHATRARGNRVVAVGTTVVRALEAFALYGAVSTADIFIQPGHQFRMFDALITNFHQPDSSHLLLVEAFLGRARLEQAYEFALNHDFRFLSYGDAMLILS